MGTLIKKKYNFTHIQILMDHMEIIYEKTVI